MTAQTPTIVNAYWDKNTSVRTSAAGTGYTTVQMRRGLPAGFSNAWAITRNRSYPFLNDANIEFSASLATLVNRGSVFTFLPMDQHDDAQYSTPPTGGDALSLAAVYAMIARAIGVTGNFGQLKNVKVDRYFWDDAGRTARWRGPVTTYATLGSITALAARVALANSNVVGEMKSGKLVILRGTYTKSNGAKAEHWMLGTLYTGSGTRPDTVVANDPWTGMQVTIDPATKRVVSPANFPLTDFKVDGYQTVTLESLA